ncbi:hypothetical protein HanIR_Chr07g0310591 [Helianthus annuus]|nr:hypothetical protein HanIR_Chr07g0310591 [Helianthus annuus]
MIILFFVAQYLVDTLFSGYYTKMGYKINQEIRQSIYIKHLNKEKKLASFFLSWLSQPKPYIHTHPSSSFILAILLTY